MGSAYKGIGSGMGSGTDSSMNSDTPYLVGHLLVAMPHMTDPRFAKTVIYVCAHNADGAMGLVVNRPMEHVHFPEVLDQLGILSTPPKDTITVQFGGPVEEGRGFVLHTSDYMQKGTMMVDEKTALTGTLDILEAIADGGGPNKSILALGYAGWGPGQLDQEILDNGWLSVEADTDIVFADDLDTKWNQAMTKLGIDVSFLNQNAGHA